MDYAVWNPVPWCLFLFGLLLCIISVKVFHRKYPEYPFGQETCELRAGEIAIPFKHLNEGSLPRCRVPENTLVSTVEQLLASGVLKVGVEDSNGNLIGVIGVKEISASAGKFSSNQQTSVM